MVTVNIKETIIPPKAKILGLITILRLFHRTMLAKLNCHFYENHGENESSSPAPCSMFQSKS